MNINIQLCFCLDVGTCTRKFSVPTQYLFLLICFLICEIRYLYFLLAKYNYIQARFQKSLIGVGLNQNFKFF